MRLTPDEKTALLAVALSAPLGEPVKTVQLQPFFDRPVKQRRAIQSLVRWQLLTHDPFKGEVRILATNVLRTLACGPAATQPVLFKDERPLDAALAAECVPKHEPRVFSHADCVKTHAHVTSTSNRQNVSTIKRETCVPECEPVALMQEVQAFVGQQDFDLHWRRERFWMDPARCAILAGTVRYLKAGIQAGECKTLTTAGRHLWNQYQHDCRAKGISARV